jgi:hypothetical protein
MWKFSLFSGQRMVPMALKFHLFLLHPRIPDMDSVPGCA